MDTNKILNKFLGNIKKEQSSFKSKKSFNTFKPLKQQTIADKPVQIFNKHPIPKKSIIQKAYKKIPDDTSIPLQFMTRKQYLKKYVKNQELQNGMKFDKQTKTDFFKNKKGEYGNIVGRYTTKNNPHYPAAVVIFNDPNNFKNIKGNKFDDLVFHEYGHELAEKEKFDMPLYKEEQFADNISDYGTSRKIFSDKRAKNYALKRLQNIQSDKQSKNKWDMDKAQESVNYYNSIGEPRYIETVPIDKINIRRNEGELKTGDNYFFNTQTHKEEPLSNLSNMINNKYDKIELPVVNKKNGRYQVSDGRHRIMATSDILGKTEVPVVVWKDDDKPINDIESKNKINIPFITKKTNKEPDFYQDVTDETFREEQQYKQNLENNSYGEVKSYSGEKVGNAMIVADMVIPTGRTLSLAGLGVKKYVDKVKFVKTDEHDNKYKIPRMEVHKKSNNDKWTPEHRNEYYDNDGYREIQSDEESMNSSKPNKLMKSKFDKLNIIYDEDNHYKNRQYGSRKTFRNSLYNVFKKHPDLIKETDNVVFTKNYDNLDEQNTEADFTPEFERGKFKRGIISLPLLATSNNKKFKNALNIRHELQHKKQIENLSYDEYDRKFSKEDDLEWEDRPSEHDAVNAEYDYYNKYLGNTNEVRAHSNIMKKFMFDKIKEKEAISQFKHSHPKMKQSIQDNNSKRISQGMQKLGEGASIEKQNEWKNMSGKQRNIERQNNPDTDGDRVPDEYDCQPDNGIRQDTIYSVRGFHEKNPKGKIYPSDAYERMRGRGTGWFGTGAYGYDDKEKALEDAKRNKGYVREFEIKNPLKFKGTYGHSSSGFHDLSKEFFYASEDDELEKMSFALENYTNKRFSIDELKNIKKEAKDRNVNPINVVLEKSGFDGVIPESEYQNRTYGSVAFKEGNIEVDNKPLSIEEKRLRKEYQIETQQDKNKYNQQQFESKLDDYQKILSNPYPVRREIIGRDKDGNDIERELTQEEQQKYAEDFYGKEKIEEANKWGASMKLF